MGGKSGTTTSSVQIPPEVLARYNSVNAQAQNVAATPFKQYSTDPNAFVAPINQQQYAGIGGINQAANMAQPSIAYAQQGYTPEGFQKGVQGYMNPYLQNAVGATAAQLNNVNQQQQQQLAGNAISSGAFGGDRAGIAQGNLMNQQNLAFGQTIGNMENQGYQQAAQNYMGGLGQIGQLGLQGQQAALQGAQAQLGAGTLEQQTQQAGQTALYNQFQQQQAYPFQVAQFLAGIAEGTGALSGSTSTTTSPTSFFSDRRLKEDIKQVGKAHNGLPIYTFKYKGDPNEHTHVGFMADEVEKIHPEAVGMSHGFKTVDYKRAVKYSGGVVAEGGAVMPQHMGQGFADGGMTVAEALNNMNSMQANMPVSNGGVNNGVAASAAALNPAPVVPAAALEAPKNYFLNSSDLANSQAGAGKGASSSTWDKNQGQNNANGHGLSAKDMFEYAISGNKNLNKTYGGNEGSDHYNSQNPFGDAGGGLSDAGQRAVSDYGGIFANGGTVTTEGSNISPNDLSAIIAEQQQMYGPYSQEGMTTYGMKKGAQPGGKSSYVPQAMASAAHLMTPKDISPRGQTNTLSEITSDLGDIEKLNQYRKNLSGSGSDQTGGLLYKKPVGPGDAAHAGATLDSTTPDNLSDTFKNALSGFFGAKNGGVIDPRHGYATKGAVQMYGVDNLMSDVDSGVDQTPEQLIAEQKGMTPGSSGSGSSGASGLSTALTLGKTILGLIPFAEGGVVPREHHADGDVVGDPSDQVAMSDVGPFKMREDPKMTAGVDPRLLDIIRHESVSLPAGQSYDVTSGVRENTPANPNSLHRLGKAVDVGIMNENGTMVPNYQDPASFKAYEDPAKVGREFQQKKYPELNKDFNWGGYFSGEPGKYGAMDLMHQSIGEHPAGGSWEEGLHPEQAKLFAGYTPPKGGLVPPADIPARGAVNVQQTNAQPPQQGGGLTDTLTSEKFLVPLLSGLGKMAGSNSRYLGSAILQGIGGAAESYENVLQNQQQRALTGGQADVSRTIAAANAQTIAQNSMYKGPDGQTYVMTAQGPMIAGLWQQKLAQGQYIPTVGYDQMTQMIAKIPGAQPISGGPSGGQSGFNVPQQDVNAPRQVAPVPGMEKPQSQANVPPTFIGDAGKNMAERTYQSAIVNPTDFAPKKTISNEYEAQIAANAAAATKTGSSINQVADAILSIDPQGWNAIGPTSPVRQTITSYYNDAVSSIAGTLTGAARDKLKDYMINPNEIGSAEAANKISGLLQFAQANGADQRSLGALQTAGRVVPTTANTYEGAVDILSGMFVDKQRPIDSLHYLNDYKNHVASIGGDAMRDRYLAQDAINGFNQDHNDAQYGAEKARIKKILTKRLPDGRSLFSAMYSNKVNPKTIDEVMPGMSRYILNN